MSSSPAQANTNPTFVTAENAEWAKRLEEALALLRLVAPIALISLVNMGMSVTDTIMVSALFGTEALAAIAVGSDLYSIVFYLCAGILAGIAPFYTTAVAQANALERARIERIGWMTVGLLAVSAVPLIWLTPGWLEEFGIQQTLLTDGQGYTRAMALTLVPMLAVILYRTVLTAAEKPKVFLKVTLAMLPLNAIGNYVFMTGVGPIPSFGPTGAGISSLIVALASLAVLVIVVRRGTPHSVSQISEAKPDWRGLVAVLRVGIPIGIATVAELGIFLGATFYAATLGAADVAAHTLTLRTAGVVYALPAALLQASMVRMARAESLHDAGACRALIFSSLGLSATFGTAIFLTLAIVAEPFATAFFDDSAAGMAAMQLAVVLLILLGLVELLIGPGSAAAGLLRGRKDTRAPMIYVLVGHWAVGAPLGIYLCEAHGLGAIGIWIGLAAGTFLTTLLTLTRLFTRTHAFPAVLQHAGHVG
jgi:MATE family multidrug resistance protein